MVTFKWLNFLPVSVCVCVGWWGGGDDCIAMSQLPNCLTADMTRVTQHTTETFPSSPPLCAHYRHKMKLRARGVITIFHNTTQMNHVMSCFVVTLHKLSLPACLPPALMLYSAVVIYNTEVTKTLKASWRHPFIFSVGQIVVSFFLIRSLF